jgi:hypothetical protein
MLCRNGQEVSEFNPQVAGIASREVQAQSLVSGESEA